MTRAVLVIAIVAATACGKSSAKPTGTANDPVTVCERLADVCRIERSRLGVCTPPTSGVGLVCASQH